MSMDIYIRAHVGIAGVSRFPSLSAQSPTAVVFDVSVRNSPLTLVFDGIKQGAFEKLIPESGVANGSAQRIR
jgi:hypothetical protein